MRRIIELISPIGYAHEVQVCNDLASAGGNVELMTQSGGCPHLGQE